MSQSGTFRSNVFPPGSVVATITGNAGGAVSPDAGNNINTLGSGNITVTGNPGTNTLTATLTGTTNHTVQLGNAGGSLTSLANGINGQVLHAVSGANDPIWAQVNLNTDVTNVLPIANGGTNASTMATTYGVNYFDGTRIVTTLVGTATHVLTSNGVGVAPTFQAIPGSVTSITGNSGGAQSGAITLVTANATPTFVGAAGTITLDFNKSNLMLGSSGPSITTAVSTVAVGLLAAASTTSGRFNTAIGYEALALSSTSESCTAVGAFALLNATLAADNNTGIGYNSLGTITTGSYNTCLGQGSGSNLTLANSSNILIGNGGTVGDNNTIRIGTPGGGLGQQTACYIVGIDGVNIGSVAKVLTMASDKIGTATITAGTGITITPGANLITIAASGTTSLTYTDVTFAMSPYTVLATDAYLSVNSTAGAVTLRFPNAATSGRTYIIKDRTGTANTNNITVTTVGGVVLLDGATTYVMNTQYAAIELMGNATSFEVF